MATIQYINQIDYPSCPSHFEELSMVCLEKKCLKDLLICPLCEVDKHSEHTVVSLKQYLLETVSREGIENTVLDDINQIEEMRERAMNQLVHLKENFLSEMYYFQQQILDYFSNVEEKFIRISALNNSSNVLKMLHAANQAKSSQKFHNLVESLRLYSSSPPRDALKHYISWSQSKLSTFKGIYNSIKINESFKLMKSLFTVAKDPTFRPTFFWGEQKGQKIQVNDLVASQTASSSNGERFALMSSHKNVNDDIVVGIKVRKLKGWIGVGICLHNVIVNGNYKFNYTQNYHGSYLISTNGYSWSHSQTAFNSAQKSFSYVEGDTIKITYEVDKHQVLFENSNKMSSFTLQVIDPPLGDYYVPCVNMCNPGDEVEIVNGLE